MAELPPEDIEFLDREDAGRQLAQRLEKHKDQDPVVLALPRGGVVPGAEVAKQLGAPLDLAIVRKLGHPEQPEFALGAVTDSGEIVTGPEWETLPDLEQRGLVWGQRREARRRRQHYLGSRSPERLRGKTAILVDDGIATGHTMRAAIRGVQKQGPARVVVAVPVLPRDVADQLVEEADEVVAVSVPDVYRGSVGSYYREFAQVSDQEVVDLMKRFTA